MLAGWKLSLSDDRSCVVIQLPGVALDFRITADQVDRLVGVLAGLRGQMAKPFPPTLAPGTKITAIPDPRWASETDVLTGHSLLHVRDPRFGWLHYLLPRREARRLGDALKFQSAGIPGARTERPN